jgi:two-component system response regulator TctD
MKLLLIEDDAAMQTALKRALSQRDISVTLCSNGFLALEQWVSSQADVVMLDLSLPGQDGLQVLAQARAQGLTTPVLILTARSTVGDRVMGLNLGADDYLAKPFDLDELEARLRALHRRHAKTEVSAVNLDTSAQQYSVGELRYDQSSGAIYHLGLALELTPRELTLLQTLMLRPGHAVAKEKLFDLVFPGATDVQYEAVEVVVYRLRKKLSGKKVNLMTLRGLGYLLKAEG